MKVIIEIDCETIIEVQAHLSVIKKQLKSHTKKMKYNPDQELPNNTFLSDDNCYGSHTLHTYED